MLLDDPKGTLERELGTQLPEGVEVRVLQERADAIYLVLPSSASPLGGQGGEISDRELEAVAGGEGGTWGTPAITAWDTFEENLKSFARMAVAVLGAQPRSPGQDMSTSWSSRCRR
jgi:hypothetical protein